MIERYLHNKITWLDVSNPSPEEIRTLVDECDVPIAFANNLTASTPKTEIFSKKGFMRMTLHFPIVKRTDINHPHQVTFLITPRHFITVRFEEIECIHRFSKEYEVLCMLHGKDKGSSVQLFTVLLGRFYDALYVKLDYIESKLKDIEEEIFKEHEAEMVYELSNVSRRLILFRQAIDAHEDALEKLPDALKDAFNKDQIESSEAILHHYKVVKRRLKALKSTLDNLRLTNDSLLETKQNSIMKVLTIISFITFPLMLFSSMFGMNTENTPILGNTLDFWIIVGIMVAVSVVFLIFFKYKKWL